MTREEAIAAVARGKSLRGAYLVGADFGGADLCGADLGGASLCGAYLGGADLGGAYLGGADLGGAYLGGADLSEADLSEADLSGADLRRAYLAGADLHGAYLGGTKEAPARVISAQAGRCYRSDGYEFIAFRGFEGGAEVIRAGRRTFSLAEFRAHAAGYASEAKRAETLEILDFLEHQLNRESWN